MILSIAEMSVVTFKSESYVNKDLLYTDDITQALEHTGLPLTTNLTVNPALYKMGEVEPKIYQFRNFDGMLFIYQFASIGERIKTNGNGKKPEEIIVVLYQTCSLRSGHII